MTLVLLLATMTIIASFFGWGALVRRALRLTTPDAINLALGIAALIAVGGILVVFSAVSVGVVFVLLFGGVVIAAIALAGAWRQGRLGTGWRHHLGTLIASPLIFWVHHRPADFNLHDDVEKYLKYPVRLLQTGNLQTGPFDALGTEALGGMSFLHALALAMGPIEFVNVIDQVVGLLVCALLIGACGQRLRVPWGGSVAATMLLIAIDPLKANVSANYAGAALLIGCFALVASGPKSSCELTAREAGALGLLCAGLVALKTSLALILPILFLAFAAVGIGLAANRARMIRSLAIVPITAVVLTLPWLGAHAAKFSAGIGGGSSPDVAVTTGIAEQGWAPFATGEMGFGFAVGHAHYTALVLVYLCLGIGLLRSLRGHAPRLAWVAGSLGIGIALNYGLGQFWGAPRMVGYENGLRYQLPLVLLGTVVGLIAAARTREGTGRADGSGSTPWLSRGALGLLVASLIAFAPSFVERYRPGPMQGFERKVPVGDLAVYTQYHAYLRSAQAREQMQQIQARVPPESQVLVWTLLGAFHLDYARNPIWDVDPAGLASPWLGLRFDDPPRDQVRTMTDYGIEYLIWHYAGPGVRTPDYLAATSHSPFDRDREIFGRTQRFTNLLSALSQDPQLAEIVYADESTRVLRLLPP